MFPISLMSEPTHLLAHLFCTPKSSTPFFSHVTFGWEACRRLPGASGCALGGDRGNNPSTLNGAFDVFNAYGLVSQHSATVNAYMNVQPSRSRACVCVCVCHVQARQSASLPGVVSLAVSPFRAGPWLWRQRWAGLWPCSVPTSAEP